MKRFHIHTHVADLAQSIDFYNKLFGAEPTRVESDYAKWMLDDPRINFAISTRGGALGIDHLGFQVDAPEELDELKARAFAAQAASDKIEDEGATTCCYARSVKHWVIDPTGIAWEQFHTLADIPVFREAPDIAAAVSRPAPEPASPALQSATPAPQAAGKGKPVGIPVRAASCC